LSRPEPAAGRSAPASDERSENPLAYRRRAAAVLDVSGPDAADFLQGQVTQDVRGMTAGEVRPAAGLTPKGKLLYVARVLALPDRLRLLLPATLRVPVRDHLSKYAAFQKAVIEDRSEDFLRLGLYAAPPLETGAGRDWIPLPGEGEFAAEILVSSSEGRAIGPVLRDAGFREIDAESAEALRVQAGRPRYGQDFDGSHLPDEVGLAEAISTTKGCYVGQEIVARLRTYGRVNRRLVGFRFSEGSVAPGAVLRPETDEGPSKVEWGRVTSAVRSPRFGPIGLGFAFREVELGARLMTRDVPTRGAVVAALPFR